MQRGTGKSKEGYFDAKNCYSQVLRDAFEWIWADTSCINKSGSADLELLESINSMFG